MDKNWKQAKWLPLVRDKILLLCEKRKDWVPKDEVIDAVIEDSLHSNELSEISSKMKDNKLNIVGNMIDWLDARLTEYEKGTVPSGWVDFVAGVYSKIERKGGERPYVYRLRRIVSPFQKRHWILVGKDKKQLNGRKTSIQIYTEAMRSRYWGIKEKARNIGKLRTGDKAVFYLGDSGKSSFYGTATLSSPYLDKKVAHEKGHNSGIELVNIEIWNRRKLIGTLIKKLGFIKNKSDYMQYLRGSVHEISEADYRAIVGIEDEDERSLVRSDLDEESDESDFEITEPHKLTQTVRKIRLQEFAKATKENYGFSCSVCGASMFSNKGIPETEAAHIYPMALNGSNDLRNGIALCRLHHWAFENGLFSIRDNCSIIIEPRIKKNAEYKEINRFGNRKIRLPRNHHPHSKFLREHRRIHDFK